MVVLGYAASISLVVLLSNSSPESEVLAFIGNGVLGEACIWSSSCIATFLLLQLLYFDTFNFSYMYLAQMNVFSSTLYW